MATLVTCRYRRNYGGVGLVFSEGYPVGWRVNFFKGVVKPILRIQDILYGGMGMRWE